MKKIFSILILFFVIICGGCNISIWDNNLIDKSVPKGEVSTTLTSSTADLSVLYNNCVKSVVTVLNYAKYYEKGETVTVMYGSGSGFVYEYDNDYIYVYTNAHVVNVGSGYTQSHYEVVFYDGYRSNAILCYSDGSEDVAIMKISRGSQNFAKASLGNSDVVVPGEDIFSIGSPLGLEYANTITRGIVSNVKVEMETDDDKDGNYVTMYMIQVDAALNPGNSGGPMFNMNGEVVGVSTLKLMKDSSNEDVEAFNFIIPINHFVLVANCLASDGSYARPKLGISVLSISDMDLNTRQNNDINVNWGIYISSVSSTGASYGTLNKGDIITKINDVVIGDLADFSVELYKFKKGEDITLTICDGDGSNVQTKVITLN